MIEEGKSKRARAEMSDGAVGHVDRRADFAACRLAAVRRMACIAGRTRAWTAIKVTSAVHHS